MARQSNGETGWRDLLGRLAKLMEMTDVRRLRTARLDRTVRPMARPASRHLPIALTLGNADSQPICVLLNQLKYVLHWRQNPSYAGAEFLDGYAYCELLGPSGHWVHPRLALGLLLLGPEVTYPEHAHPAEEIYAVIAGRAQWRQADDVWRLRIPGEIVHHASMEPHAMRTTDEPLLAAYLWQDHLHEGARLLAR